MAPFLEISRRAAYYQPVVLAAARKYGMPASLLNGLIAQESRFVNGQFRPEPHLPRVNGEVDGSSGLVQVLFSTARAMGYRGRRVGLNDPPTNIELGARYLADQIRLAKGDIPAALSRYNGGYRPSAGLGARAKTSIRGVASRNADGSVKAYKIVPAGRFLNQDYVDAVLAYAERFKAVERTMMPAPRLPAGRLQGAAVEGPPTETAATLPPTRSRTPLTDPAKKAIVVFLLIGAVAGIWLLSGARPGADA